MNPVILVGRRSDGGRRDLIWTFCKRFWTEHLEWPIYEGFHDEGSFSLSAASNQAARLANIYTPEWDVALYVGADFIVGDPRQAPWAADLALRKEQLVFAHNAQFRLSLEGTDAALAGADYTQADMESGPHFNTFSGVLALPRDLWEEVGGFDERFESWGWEDLAFWASCSAMRRGFERIEGTLYHLWHERSEEVDDHANEPLGRRYLDAKTNRFLMTQILGERNQ